MLDGFLERLQVLLIAYFNYASCILKSEDLHVDNTNNNNGNNQTTSVLSVLKHA